MVTARFDRTAKEALEKLLLPAGALHPLVVAPGKLRSLDVPLVAHLRFDRMTIYAGLTSLLQIRITNSRLAVSATDSYARQPCAAAILGHYQPADAASIVERWPAYRDSVEVAERYVRREGFLQASLIERYGRGFKQGDEWCVVDREAVIAYPSAAKLRAYEETVRQGFRSVRRAIEADSSIRTGKKLNHDFGRELDLLAVTNDVSHQRRRDDSGGAGREPRRFRGGTDERATEDHG